MDLEYWTFPLTENGGEIKKSDIPVLGAGAFNLKGIVVVNEQR